MLVLSSSIVWLKNTGSGHSSCSQLAFNWNPFCKLLPAYVNIRDCVCACACAHNYRCAIPPKLSLEKGMGMTPGYNHRLRLRNVLFSDPVLSRRQLKTPRSCTAYCLWKRCSLRPETSLLFFPSGIFSLSLSLSFIFGKKKNQLCVFMSLSVCLALFGGGGGAYLLLFSERPCEGAVSLASSFHPGMPVALRQKRK